METKKSKQKLTRLLSLSVKRATLVHSIYCWLQRLKSKSKVCFIIVPSPIERVYQIILWYGNQKIKQKLTRLLSLSVKRATLVHYSEGWFDEFCCTRPGTKPPFATSYIHMSWVLYQFFPVQYLGQQGFWVDFVPSPSLIAIIQPHSHF